MTTQNEADKRIIEAAQALEKVIQINAQYRETNQQLMALEERVLEKNDELAKYLETAQALLMVTYAQLTATVFDGDFEKSKAHLHEITEGTGIITREAEDILKTITDALTQPCLTVH